jgi:predicted AAA+ superfamily ATPase
VGKTCLSQSLPDIEYFDCELPRVRRQLEDPEAFLADAQGKRVVLDEIHRLENPSQLLKIAADHFPETRILATGSSTLAASRRFRDTLTGRKRDLWLTPMTQSDLRDFERPDMKRRLLHGGLPPFFLSSKPPEREFQEWMDGYWAKDVQELFRVARRAPFQRFVELLLTSSGSIFEATRYAQPCEVSRPTISSYLAILDATLVAHIIRPYSRRRSTEIVSAPKVYGFDTGFVCYHRGWHSLRTDDLGVLWEHFVLNEIHANLQSRRLNYWRDKRGHEVDFVHVRKGGHPTAIECKWTAHAFDSRNLAAFRRIHSEGVNYVVASDVTRAYRKRYQNADVNFVSLSDLIKKLEA